MPKVRWIRTLLASLDRGPLRPAGAPGTGSIVVAIRSAPIQSSRSGQGRDASGTMHFIYVPPVKVETAAC